MLFCRRRFLFSVLLVLMALSLICQLKVQAEDDGGCCDQFSSDDSSSSSSSNDNDAYEMSEQEYMREMDAYAQEYYAARNAGN